MSGGDTAESVLFLGVVGYPVRECLYRILARGIDLLRSASDLLEHLVPIE